MVCSHLWSRLVKKRTSSLFIRSASSRLYFANGSTTDRIHLLAVASRAVASLPSSPLAFIRAAASARPAANASWPDSWSCRRGDRDRDRKSDLLQCLWHPQLDPAHHELGARTSRCHIHIQP